MTLDQAKAIAQTYADNVVKPCAVYDVSSRGVNRFTVSMLINDRSNPIFMAYPTITDS